MQELVALLLQTNILKTGGTFFTNSTALRDQNLTGLIESAQFLHYGNKLRKTYHQRLSGLSFLQLSFIVSLCMRRRVCSSNAVTIIYY